MSFPIDRFTVGICIFNIYIYLLFFKLINERYYKKFHWYLSKILKWLKIQYLFPYGWYAIKLYLNTIALIETIFTVKHSSDFMENLP